MKTRAHFHQGCGCGCGGHGESAVPPSRDWSEAGDEETVCHCSGVTKKVLVDAIQMGAYTLPLVKTMTGAGRVRRCDENNPSGRSCEADLAELIRLYGSPSMRSLG